MDSKTLVASLDFARTRLLGTLDTLEKSAGQDPKKLLAWRPGPGRAHIAWQFMHCAATHDRYHQVRLLGGTEKHPDLVKNFAGGSTPSDDLIPTFAEIRSKLEATYRPFRDYVAVASEQDLAREVNYTFPNNVKRTIFESVLLLAWHEAHHQGQIHLTWNLYKAAHGIA